MADSVFGDLQKGPGLCSTTQSLDACARLDELEGQRRELEARRERLELPAIDREMLAALMDHFEKVMAAGTTQQKKDLLHRVVKKVLVPRSSNPRSLVRVTKQRRDRILEQMALRT